jgi:hypothetical protein
VEAHHHQNPPNPAALRHVVATFVGQIPQSRQTRPTKPWTTLATAQTRAVVQRRRHHQQTVTQRPQTSAHPPCPTPPQSMEQQLQSMASQLGWEGAVLWH